MTLCRSGDHDEIVKTFKREDIAKNANLGLIISCIEGHVEVAKIMIKNGANVNAYDDIFEYGKKIIILSCEKGHVDIVKLLIDNGANVKAISPCGYGLFKISCINGNADMVKMLLSYDIADNESGFMKACRYGHTEVVKLLVNIVDINNVDMYGDTALIQACKFGHTDIVKLLLEAGANINHKNNEGYTGFIASCAWNERTSDTIQLLIDRGANLYHRNNKGHTGFVAACTNYMDTVVNILIYNNVDIIRNECNGNSILKLMFNKKYRREHSHDLLMIRWINIIKLIVSSYDDHREHITDLSTEDVESIEAYVKTDEHKKLKKSICDKRASKLFSWFVLLSDDYYKLK